MSRQVDVASGCLCERKKFSRRILPLRSAKRLLERAPSIYYRLGSGGIPEIVGGRLPSSRLLDSTRRLDLLNMVQPAKVDSAPIWPPDSEIVMNTLFSSRRNTGDIGSDGLAKTNLSHFAIFEATTARARDSGPQFRKEIAGSWSRGVSALSRRDRCRGWRTDHAPHQEDARSPTAGPIPPMASRSRS